MNKYKIRPFRPGDEEAILELHNLSFAGHEARRRQHWIWKFVDNPLKKTEIMIAERDDGKCMGLFSGIKQRFLIDNKPCFCSNQVDVATHESLRRGMLGARLLVDLVKQYYVHYTGGETKMAWGFPEPALHRIGLHFMKWGVLRDVVYLVREPEPFADPPAEIEVRAVDRFGPDADGLWEQCAQEINTGLVRNAAYLNWRYADHPDIPHLLFEARERGSGALRGLTTLRQGGWDESIMSVMDWLVPVEDRVAEAALVQQSLRAAAQHGREYLAYWFPAPRLQFTRFQRDHGFFAYATPYQECFRPFFKKYDRRWYERHWYQTIGDIDFF